MSGAKELGWDREPPPPKRAPGWGRRLALAGLVLVILAVGGYWWWGHNAERRLAKLLDELKRNGEPTTPADLVPAAISPPDNAALDYRAAASLLDTKDETWKAFGNIDFEKPLNRKSIATITKLVETEKDVFEQVRAARNKPDADWQINYVSPMLQVLLPDLNEQRNIAQLCRAAVLYDRLKGDDAAAVEHLHDILRIGRSVSRHCVMIGHLVALGINSIGHEEIVRLAPGLSVAPGGEASGRRPAPRDQVVALVRELLDESPLDRSAREALRAERVMELDTATALLEGRLNINALLGASPRAATALPPLPRPLIVSDTLVIVGYTGDVLRAFETSGDYQTYKRNVPPWPKSSAGFGQAVHLLVNALLPSFERMALVHYRCLAERRMAAAALALRLYALDHGGKYPQSLDELVPKYLPAVPKDPFAAGGRATGYDATDPADVKLYSVGENGTDAGGSEASTAPRRRTNPGRWERDDAVIHLKPQPLITEGAEDEGE